LDVVVGPLVVVGCVVIVVVVVVVVLAIVVVVVVVVVVGGAVVVLGELVDVVLEELVDAVETVPLLYGKVEVPKLGDAAQATCNPLGKAVIAIDWS